MKKISHADRTDALDVKLRLLEQAYRAGDFDLALSLAESAKETLDFEKQQRGSTDEPAIPAGHFVPIDQLPRSWSQWARGWSVCKPLQLFETVGIERAGEPVDLLIAFQEDQASDLARELRVARVDPRTNTLREIPCQVHDETRQIDNHQRRCRLVFMADVRAHQNATYLAFAGNPLAERTDVRTDLHTTGEGVGLDIENRYFTARLSRQGGQLERLIYKRQHGLELYAGGKGHGEPPGIDWAHDYVDVEHFQKLRMRNWADCPNHEVTRGPLFVRVRRWGFPWSPVHPLFTPSRVHMDQTYTFYAGLPYFIKQGRIDAVKDVTIEAMRDDEWVFSGYSFTDMLWIDSRGKLHEGAVPPESGEKLWGVGFFNRTSHDAFIALRLDHSATGIDGPKHGGVPTLHYDGHGQLWSRYPAEHADLKAGTSIRQKNAYLVSAYEPGQAAAIEKLRHQLANPLEVHPAELPKAELTKGDMARVAGALARPGETKETAPLKPMIWKALHDVRDEQLYKANSNVVDMGYVYDVRERDGVVMVLVTMPHRGRPVYDFLVASGGGRLEPGIRDRLMKLEGVRDVLVDFTWNPPWNVSRLTDAGRREMGFE